MKLVRGIGPTSTSGSEIRSAPLLHDADVRLEDVEEVLLEWARDRIHDVSAVINVGPDRRTVFLAAPQAWALACREAKKRGEIRAMLGQPGDPRSARDNPRR